MKSVHFGPFKKTSAHFILVDYGSSEPQARSVFTQRREGEKSLTGKGGMEAVEIRTKLLMFGLREV